MPIEAWLRCKVKASYTLPNGTTSLGSPWRIPMLSSQTIFPRYHSIVTVSLVGMSLITRLCRRHPCLMKWLVTGPIRTMPNPGRHPVLGLTLAQVAQVPAQVQAVKTPARTRLAADQAAARAMPTAMPKAMLQGARSGRRRNRINPSMRSQTKNLLQR